MKIHETMEKAEFASHLLAWQVLNSHFIKDLQDAKEFATLEKIRVAAYRDPIFASYAFFDEDDNSRITDPDQLYNADPDDGQCDPYYAELAAAHVKNGWKGDPTFCPHLVAQSAISDLEREILTTFSDLCGMPLAGICAKWESSLQLALKILGDLANNPLLR
ncbi:MAG: hypothetical protein L3J47_00115 [Sulfurovum sp.]|nr:hypothetical protein [Sulfurovum sp.]